MDNSFHDSFITLEMSIIQLRGCISEQSKPKQYIQEKL